jgi:hypothetical protein
MVGKQHEPAATANDVHWNMVLHGTNHLEFMPRFELLPFQRHPLRSPLIITLK